MSVKQVRRILLVGYYGQKNSGDDALLSAAIELLGERYPGALLSVLAPAEVPTSSNHNVRFSGSRRLVAAREVLLADMVVFGGGGIFQDYGLTGTKGVRTILLMVLMARLLGRRLLFLSISIGPLSTLLGKAYTWTALSLATGIVVRDSESLRLARTLGVRRYIAVGPDLSVALFRSWPSRRRQELKCLGFCPANFSGVVYGDQDSDIEFVSRVARALIRFAAHHQEITIKLISFHGGERGDEDLCRRIATILKEAEVGVEVVAYQPDILKVIEAVDGCDALITVRLHAAIFGYLLNKPMIVVRYHPKVDGFLSEVGLNEAGVLPNAGDSEWDEALSRLGRPETPLPTVAPSQYVNELEHKLALLK